MKQIQFVIALLATISLAACTALPLTPVQTPATKPAAETEIRQLVEQFGMRLQHVSVQSPNAAQEMQSQYAGLVSPALLAAWMNDPSEAPGRIVSSPWPDRIEITTLIQEASGRYVIEGFVVEVTSVEVVSGGVAARIPVRVVVENDQGRWLITGYAEER